MIVSQALVDALQRFPVVVVRAPAGYGKTTTVRGAVAQDENVAWYDAQPWERDAFIDALVTRVRDVRPEVGRRTVALAASAAPFDRVGAAFAEELAHVDAPLRIVVDDAHVLGPQFGTFARALVGAMPRSVRIAIVTREPIELGLPQMIASDHAALIDAETLRFDAVAVTHLAKELGVGIDAARAAAVARRTDGWPLAVALALRTTSDALLDELVAQRIGELDATAREALSAMVAYETVEPDVAAPGDRGLLVTFERLATDATLVGRVGAGYRIHPLVREALLKEIEPGVLRTRHAAAAATYSQAGRLRPTLFHLERAHNSVADTAFLRGYAQTAIAAGLTDGIRATLGRVRSAKVNEPALFALVDGLLAKSRGDDPRAFFAAAKESADRSGDAPVAFDARLEAIEADLARGTPVDVARIDELLERGIALGPIPAAGAAARAGWADAVAGRFASALARLDAVPDTGDVVVRSNLAPLEAYAHIALGDFEAAERVAAAFVELSSASDELARYAGALVWAARFALIRGDSTAAYELSREGERIGRPFAQRSTEAAMQLTLAEAALHVGDMELARRASRSAQRAADAAWYSRDADRARALAPRFLARAAALDGDPAAALAMLKGDDALTLADAAIFAALARTADASARASSAHAAVPQAQPIDAGDAIAIWSATELLAFVAPSRNGEASPAAGGGPFDGLIARRLEAGSLAQRVARLDDAPSFETTIARRFRGGLTAAAPMAPAPLIEPLTAREAEILALLVAGLTNGEIAQRLILSPRTVETHVARITGKFAVNSRARAVARAVALGIVAPPADSA